MPSIECRAFLVTPTQGGAPCAASILSNIHKEVGHNYIYIYPATISVVTVAL